MRAIKVKFPFVDAQVMRLLHPETFSAPTIPELEELKIGDFVKVCPDCDMSERFWVTVIKIEGEKVIGKVANYLVCTDMHGLFRDDVIKFEKKNIYAIDSK